jgi:hypothetical protein
VRTEGTIFVGVAVFFLVVTGIYWFTSYEDTGTVLLLLTAGLGAIPGAWLLYKSRKIPTRLEDQEEANPEEGAGVVGSFPETSVWPLVLALGVAVAGVGLVFGAWLVLPGIPLVLVALIGGILEGRRGVDEREEREAP